MTEYFNRASEKHKRRQLRNNMPPAEVLLWSRLQRPQLADCRFRRQYSVGPYVIDFYSAETRLGIEVDGDSHFVEGAPEYDAKRTVFLGRFGLKVLRFLNTDIYESIDGVLETIAREVESRRGRKQPPPAPPFQGGESL